MDPYRNFHRIDTDSSRYYGQNSFGYGPHYDQGHPVRNGYQDQGRSGSVAHRDDGRVERFPHEGQGPFRGVASNAQGEVDPRDSFWDRVRQGDAPLSFQFEGSIYEGWGKPGADVPKFSIMRDRMVAMKKKLHDYGYPTWAYILNPSNRVSFAHTGRVLMETFEAFVRLERGVTSADIRQVKFLAKKTKKNFNWGSHTFLGPREKVFIVTPENQVCALKNLEEAFQVVLKYFDEPRQQSEAQQAPTQPPSEEGQEGRAVRNVVLEETRRKKRNESANASYHGKKKAAEAGNTEAIEWIKERRKRNRESARKSRAKKKHREMGSTDLE